LVAFVVFGLVFPYQALELGERLRNDFCVEWDVKPQLNQSINPQHLRSSSVSNGWFQRGLKTHLLRQVYSL